MMLCTDTARVAVFFMSWAERLGQASDWAQVLEAVTPPLALVDAVPHSLSAYAEHAPKDPAWITTWWSTCQHTLLTTTLVTWAPAMHRHGVYDAVLHGWFTPSGDSAASANVWSYTLGTCSALLAGRLHLHPATFDALEQILTRFDAQAVLIRTIDSVRNDSHAARRHLRWDEAVSQITALPTRVANTFGPRKREALLDLYQGWLAHLSGAICRVLPDEAQRISLMLARFARSGFLTLQRAPTFWDVVLPQTNDAWHAVFDACDAPTQETLVSSLTRAQQRQCRALPCAWPVARTEHAPGTEGRAFLTDDALRWAYTVYTAFENICGSADGSRVDLMDVDLVCGHADSSPLCAIGCTAWIMARDAEVSFNALIKRWSDARRIRLATYTYEQCITAMILVATRILHGNAVLSTHAQSPLFLQGVSSHLEHTDARIRRLGMLVAEVLSQATNPAPLRFPPQVWDGRGDGRGVCRVLRAMYERTGPLWPDPRPFSWPKQAAVPSQPTAVAPPAPARRASPPTIRLPRRVEPARPLILEIGASDAQDVPVQPFQKYAYETDESESEQDDNEDDSRDTSTMLGDAVRKKSRIPVYIYELAPLARERDFDANKRVLKHAEKLIRRKTGWGHEITEHATDLAFALAAMQDTYEIQDFDMTRTNALAALCVAAPEPVVDALYEQFFSPHYSLVQRLSILRAVAAAAREMCGFGSCPSLSTAADNVARAAAGRAQALGENRIAASHATDMTSIRAAKVDDMPHAPSWSVRPTPSFTAIAPQVFIFPLIRRLDQARQTSSRIYAGRDTTLTPSAVSAVLHILCVLCYHGRHAAFFTTRVLPDVLEVVEVWGADTKNQDVWTAAMALALVVLDIAIEDDGGLRLARSHPAQLLRIQALANVFADSSQYAAAVVLCIADTQERARQAFLRS